MRCYAGPNSKCEGGAPVPARQGLESGSLAKVHMDGFLGSDGLQLLRFAQASSSMCKRRRCLGSNMSKIVQGPF